MHARRHYVIPILLISAALIALSVVAAGVNGQISDRLGQLTMSSAFAVFAAGLLAGFNPCLLAMLAFLASTILASTGRRKEVLTMVIFFSLGTFAVYIIFGVGLFNILQEKSTAAMFRFVLAAILLILGLMQLEDARRLQSGGSSLFRTDWTKKYVTSIVASRRLSYYFLLGALFSLVRAPCVGGVYIAIIGIISSRGYASSGLFYLIVYNLGLAIPVLLLGGIIALGMSPAQVDLFREKHRVAIRFDYRIHAYSSGCTHLPAIDLAKAFDRFSWDYPHYLPFV